MHRGYIKLWRKFEDWEWYQDSKTVHLFVHLLMNANHKDRKWKGIIVKKGQLITGLLQLNADTGISIQSIRTSLKKLKSTGKLTSKSTNHYSIITICNYESYQPSESENNTPTNRQTNKPLTSQQQATNKPLTTNKNVKNVKNEKNKNIVASESRFEEIYANYPKKDSRKSAERFFFSSVKTEKDWEDIQIALKNYKQELTREDYRKPKSAATWFNNWTDWTEFKDEKHSNMPDSLKKFL